MYTAYFPETENDREYKRQGFRTSMNLATHKEKRAGGNFVFQTLAKNYQSSADFDLNFPWKKVAKFYEMFFF